METREAFQGHEMVLRLNARRVAAMVVIYGAVVALTIACNLGLLHLAFRGRPEPLLICFLLGAPLLGWHSIRVNFDPRRKFASIFADARGVVLDGRLEVPRRSILVGDFVRHQAPLGNRLCLMGHFGVPVLELQMNDAAKASQILAALSLDENATAHFPVLSPWRASVVTRSVSIERAIFLVMMVVMRLSARDSGALGTVFYTTLVVLGSCAIYFFPARASVGRDGIKVASLFSRKFIPYSRVSEIDHDSSAVRLFCADGTIVFLRTRAPGPKLNVVGEPAPLHARAQAAFARWNEGGSHG